MGWLRISDPSLQISAAMGSRHCARRIRKCGGYPSVVFGTGRGHARSKRVGSGGGPPPALSAQRVTQRHRRALSWTDVHPEGLKRTYELSPSAAVVLRLLQPGLSSGYSMEDTLWEVGQRRRGTSKSAMDVQCALALMENTCHTGDGVFSRETFSLGNQGAISGGPTWIKRGSELLYAICRV